jgi:opacity protein-like surface antigen
MKKTLMAGVSLGALALSGLVVSAPTSPAEAGNVYLALGAGGIGLHGNRDWDCPRCASSTGTKFHEGEMDTEAGVIFEGAIGYDTQVSEVIDIRFEVQVSNFDVDIPSVFWGSNSDDRGPPNQRSGDMDQWLFMLNALVDIGDFGGLVPYIGAGAGLGYTTLNVGHHEGPPFVQFDEDDDAGFAWQILAGASFPIGVNLDFYGNYRLIGLNGGNFDGPNETAKGVDFDMDLAHAFTIGVRYNWM